MNPSSAENVFAGIDVGAEELVLVLRKDCAAEAAQSFRNTAADRARLVRLLAKYPAITLCLEATGTYSMELSIALFDAGLRLMVVNPQASHNLAKVLGKHSKTDQVDADTLAQFAECMPFKPWQRPSDAQLALRAFARRIRTLTDDRTAAKNQLHATDFNQHAPAAVLKDVKHVVCQDSCHGGHAANFDFASSCRTGLSHTVPGRSQFRVELRQRSGLAALASS